MNLLRSYRVMMKNNSLAAWKIHKNRLDKLDKAISHKKAEDTGPLDTQYTRYFWVKNDDLTSL